MKTINQIAKINLQRIYGKDECIRALNFIEGDYNLDRVLALYDTRTLAEVEAEGNDPFPHIPDVEFADDPNYDPNNITELLVWGIRLGLPEIPLYAGTKAIIDRIMEEENKTCWIMNGKRFSHLVIERQVAIKNGYPIYEVDVYQISEAQWQVIKEKM